MKERLARLFEPVWAGPWHATRWLFVLSQVWAHGARWPRLGDAYGSPDMIYTTPLLPLNDYVHWTPTTATAWWFAGGLGLAAAAIGGRLAKPGVAVYVVAAWALLLDEALNIKAHDRLALWVALGLLLGPLGIRGAESWRSPAGRWYLLVVFCAIYGSTGILKALHEPGWFDGTVLPKHLTLTNFSATPFALFVARQHWFVFIGGWWTVLFECAFPVLVWFRRTNPWLLVTAAVFHLGVLALMDVGAFSLVSLCAYPVLLDPVVARRLWERWRAT